MKFCKFTLSSTATASAGLLQHDHVVPLPGRTLFDLLEADDIEAAVHATEHGESIRIENVHLVAPIDEQEVWAAGVTYKRSQTARMEESEAAASCYDRVYVADRPELFFKATPRRTAGPDAEIRIRSDSQWNVPEPEVTLVLSSKMRLVGFTVGNDMSSRDIEGENPLYLPQAKTYHQCCGIGPSITLASAMPPADQIGIRMTVLRSGVTVFEDSTSTAQMARSFDHLIGYLARDNDFPKGAFLMTGTGIVPDTSFTLQPGDEVRIEVDGVGLLSNTVVQG